MPLVPGQAVEALWPEDGEWYNAVVRAVTNKGIELDYEDGDFRADATEAEIRVKEPAEQDAAKLKQLLAYLWKARLLPLAIGIDENGNILLVDELHTPDSSRYWIKSTYKEKMSKNEEPDSVDKEIVRKWIKKTYENPYDLAVEINIPNELRLELSAKYLQLYNLITGNTI